jgi:hypothetical protein
MGVLADGEMRGKNAAFAWFCPSLAWPLPPHLRDHLAPLSRRGQDHARPPPTHIEKLTPLRRSDPPRRGGEVAQSARATRSATGWPSRRSAGSRSRRACSSSTTRIHFNLLDTPGHNDFSEDTYRTLAAVDCAVMLVDCVKGVEPQTLKLFEVCRLRKHPGRHVRQQARPPGQEPLDLLDEIEQDVLGIPVPR